VRDVTQLRIWQGQRYLLEDTKYPEIGVVSGVGYGKSHLSVLKHHMLCMLNKRSKLSLYFAPKVDLLIENNIPLYCSLLEELGYQQGRHYNVTYGASAAIEYAHGHRVLFRSANTLAVKRIVSYTASHATIDEAGQCAETTPVEVSKRVRCPNAVALQKCYYGTPEGVGNFFFRKFNGQAVTRLVDANGNQTRFSRGNRGHNIVLHGSTYDNEVLSRGYIDEMIREFSWNANLAKAYLYGEFVPLYDHGAYDFDPAKHKQDGPTWGDRPVYQTWDFNVTRGRAGGVSWVAMQENRGDLHITNENRGTSRTTFEAVDDFITQFPVGQWGHNEIIITGDASGFSRDTRGYDDDYTIIRQKLAENGYRRVTIKTPAANPSENMRIASVNRLLSASWDQSLYVRPKCSKTIDSLLQTTIDDTGRIVKPAGETHTHFADAVGYGVSLLRPIRKPYERGGNNFAWA
jgi:hypothetical protein